MLLLLFLAVLHCVFNFLYILLPLLHFVTLILKMLQKET